MKQPVRIAVTGAAGHISYGTLFRIAAGEMLGNDQPVILQLLEITPALDALKGVVMELDDCAFPLLQGVVHTDDAETAFGDADYALLIGAKPRAAGMERKDLLMDNGHIFSAQGKALNAAASRDIKVLVVGNPANTNALIALNNAPDLEARQFTAMTRLDHNRAISQLAARTGTHSTDISRMIIWGNHSATQYPDVSHATVGGESAKSLVDDAWIKDDFIPRVQKRGAEIIDARGLSSAASAGYAGLEHMRDWAMGSAEGDWVSMAIPSDGSYGIPEGLIYSFPVTTANGDYEIVQGLEVDEFSREKMDLTKTELEEERDAVKDLI